MPSQEGHRELGGCHLEEGPRGTPPCLQISKQLQGRNILILLPALQREVPSCQSGSLLGFPVPWSFSLSPPPSLGNLTSS